MSISFVSAVRARATDVADAGYTSGEESEEEFVPDVAELAELQRLAAEFEYGQRERRGMRQEESNSAERDAELQRLAAAFEAARAAREANVQPGTAKQRAAHFFKQSAYQGAAAIEDDERLAGYWFSSFALPAGDAVRVAHKLGCAGETSDRLWPGSRVLTIWLLKQLGGDATGAPEMLADCESIPELRRVRSTIELGCGTAVVSLALARSGLVERVVATDGDEGCCELCVASTAANGLVDVLGVVPLKWGEHADSETQIGGALRACSDRGDAKTRRDDATAEAVQPARCAELVVAADVLYSFPGSATTAAPLEWTLRSLVAAGGCRYVVLAYVVRQGFEPAFLRDHLADLGAVRTVFEGTVEDDGVQRHAGITMLSVR